MVEILIEDRGQKGFENKIGFHDRKSHFMDTMPLVKTNKERNLILFLFQQYSRRIVGMQCYMELRARTHALNTCNGW